MLSSVEHEKCFITSGPGLPSWNNLQLKILMNLKNVFDGRVTLPLVPITNYTII